MLRKRPQGHNRLVIRVELSAAKWLNIHYPERNRNFRDCLGGRRLMELASSNFHFSNRSWKKEECIFKCLLKTKSKLCVLVSNQQRMKEKWFGKVFCCVIPFLQRTESLHSEILVPGKAEILLLLSWQGEKRKSLVCVPNFRTWILQK